MIDLDVGVSVVIPSLGKVESLKKSLKSVLNQTYHFFEIIVVLDGENLEAFQFLEEFKKRNNVELTILMNKIRLGGSESRNIGIEQAKYSWIALLDDDDEWMEDKLEKQIEALKMSENPKVTICFTSIYTFKNNGKIIMLPRHNYLDQEIGYYLFGTKFGRNYGVIQTSSIMANKELFLKTPFTKGLPKHQDWDWTIRAVIERKAIILHIKEPLTIYNIDQMNSISKKNLWVDSKKWIDKNESFVSKKARDSFELNVVIKGILHDSGLDKKKKIRLLKNELKSISLRKFISLDFFKIIFRDLKFF